MRFRIGLHLLATTLVGLIAVLGLAAPAEAKVRAGLKATASSKGLVATVTLKGSGRAPVRVTLQRKAGGRWVALATGTAKRGKARLVWSAPLAPGAALRIRVVATRGKKTVAISASAVAKVARDTAPKPSPAPVAKPTPISRIDTITGSNGSGGAGGGSGGDNGPIKTTVDPPHLRVAVGGTLACAVNDYFEARCWPSNARFDQVTAPKPVDVRGVGSVGAGARHACALTDKGAYCWGDNSAYQLGADSLTTQVTIAPIGGTANSSSMVVGGDLSCVNFSTAPPICWGTTPVQPGSLATGVLPKPTTIGLGAEWKIDLITASTICARTYVKGVCFGIGGTQTPWTLDPDTRIRATGANATCVAGAVSVRCSGKAPTSPIPGDDLPFSSEIPDTVLIKEVATNGETFCGVSTGAGSIPRCWGAPAQAAGDADSTVWRGLAVKGFND